MFSKKALDNGVLVVMEQIRNVRSVALGIWVQVGSRHEPRERNGISHFLEHMFFKGTEKRTALDIAVDMDSLGGELNAFTSKESTTFYVKVLDEYLGRGVELLGDIFLGSTFPEEEIEREKSVVGEEIKMVEDTPDDYVHDLFNRSVWGEDGLGQAVLGTRDTVGGFSRENILEHIKNSYGTGNIVVACAGHFDEDALMENLNRALDGIGLGPKPQTGALPVFRPRESVHEKDLSEVHICMGVKALPQPSEERYHLLLLNTILGGGVSSRLFQEIREKRGLAYSVYSFLSMYGDTGLWGVYAGTGEEHAQEVVEHTAREFRSLAQTVTKQELERAKAQVKGNLILGLESTSRRMQNIAIQQIYYGRYYSPGEILKKIDAVTLEEVRHLAGRLASDGEVALTVLGPVEQGSLKVS
ncbi:MAG: pitrilysin family protein [Nitrospirota bacterium]|jgi:predicted Zn-dependent peptidase